MIAWVIVGAVVVVAAVIAGVEAGCPTPKATRESVDPKMCIGEPKDCADSNKSGCKSGMVEPK